jgi:hypothetical protein
LTVEILENSLDEQAKEESATLKLITQESTEEKQETAELDEHQEY